VDQANEKKNSFKWFKPLRYVPVAPSVPLVPIVFAAWFFPNTVRYLFSGSKSTPFIRELA